MYLLALGLLRLLIFFFFLLDVAIKEAQPC
jgi:hypothetical protein